MTREEKLKFLSNTKVYVNGKSKEIQEKLFSLGYKWNSRDTKVIHTDYPFLYICKDMSLIYGSDMEYFSEHKNREVTAEEILNITIDKPKYRPFKDAKECWNEMLNHEPFGWILGIKYILVSSISNTYIWTNENYYTFTEAFDVYRFADGTPFGIKED